MNSTVHIYPINGACHRVGPDETAFAYRDANFATVIAGMWPDPADNEANIEWVRDYYEATAPHSEAGGYINFMSDDDQGRIQANYRRQLRPARRGQAQVRPGQPVPRQPEHRAVAQNKADPLTRERGVVGAPAPQPERGDEHRPPTIRATVIAFADRTRSSMSAGPDVGLIRRFTSCRLQLLLARR